MEITAVSSSQQIYPVTQAYCLVSEALPIGCPWFSNAATWDPTQSGLLYFGYEAHTSFSTCFSYLSLLSGFRPFPHSPSLDPHRPGSDLCEPLCLLCVAASQTRPGSPVAPAISAAFPGQLPADCTRSPLSPGLTSFLPVWYHSAEGWAKLAERCSAPGRGHASPTSRAFTERESFEVDVYLHWAGPLKLKPRLEGRIFELENSKNREASLR